MQSFLIYAPAKAEIVPTPTNGCTQIRDNGVMKISCNYNGKTVVFMGDGNCGRFPLKYQIYSANVGSVKYMLLVSADPILSNSNLKIDKVAITTTEQEYNAQYQYDQKYWSCQPLDDDGSYPGLSVASNYIIHSDHLGWDDIKPTSGPAELTVIKGIVDNSVSTASVTVANISRGTPLAANMAVCGKKENLTQPITSITGGVEKYVTDIKTKWMANITPLPDGEDKTKATEVINGMLANPDDLYNASTDIDLFKKFYDTTYVAGDKYPPKYPNVTLGVNTTDSVYSYYAGLESSLSSRAASSNFDARTFMFMIGPVLKAGGISIYQLDKLPLWTTGGLGALTDGTIHYLATSNVNDARNIVKDQLKIYFGHLYLKNNLVFNKCLAGKGDPFAFDTVANLDKIIANVDAIMESSFQDLNAFATADAGKTVCDGLKGNYIVVMMKQAFCGLLLITKQWADTAYNASMQLLATSIGVATDVTSVPTTDKAETINVGPTSANGTGDTAGGGGGDGGTVGSGSCALKSQSIVLCSGRNCDEERLYTVQLPATGLIVKEDHLVTTGDTTFTSSWPSTNRDHIQQHYTLTQTAIGHTYNHVTPWTPEEGGGKMGQGSGGKAAPNIEPWIMNMYWKTKPAAGTKVIITANGKSVVAAAGYETGPSNKEHLLGAQEEVLQAIGVDSDASVKMGFAVDQSLPFGPINCTN